jgi:AraC-like DNA-binding protein
MKKSPDAAGRRLLATISEQLIPWATSGAPFVLLSQPPRVHGTNRVSQSPAEPLPSKRGEGQEVRVQYWNNQNLNALSVPYFGCVVEGEADIVLGVTTAQCRKMKIAAQRWTIQMPTGSFFLLPPGVPISSGQRVHWNRSHPENAFNRIFWMQIHETGGNCHFSTSRNGKLISHPYSFVYSPQLLPLAGAIIREMQTQSPQYIPILYLQIGLLLRYMQRSLLALPALDPSREYSLLPLSRQASEPARAAAAIIEENLSDVTFSAERVAALLNFSTVHLNRIFRREWNTSVMAFAFERRMERACHLLRESSFNVNQIRQHCGYGSSASFVKAFVRRFGVSPTQYRAQNQRNVSPEQ